MLLTFLDNDMLQFKKSYEIEPNSIYKVLA